MTGWEIKDFLNVLRKAQEGDVAELNCMIAGYTSGCTVDNLYSTLVIRRLFDVENNDDERRILYSESTNDGDNNTPDDKQWGLTILQLSPISSFTSSFCIPNSLKNTKIRLLGDNVLEILSNEKTITTTISEIERKLKPIYGIATEDEIRDAFNTLSSQQYTIPSLPEVVYQSVESKTLGTLEFEDDEYVTVTTIDTHSVRIIMPLLDADNLLNNIANVDRLMSEKFYQKALKGMYTSMLELKNDYWLDEAEDESDEEPSPLSLDEFKERIIITEITFNTEGDATITCDADGMFADHSIAIHTDSKGIYKNSALAD